MKLTQDDIERRERNMADKTSRLTTTGTIFRMQYEIEDAHAANLELQAENALLRRRLGEEA